MPISLQCPALPLTDQVVNKIWREVINLRHYSDDQVTVRCVSSDDIKQLNHRYRHINRATNVLTFSYGDGEHDVSLCLATANQEAQQKDILPSYYIALLLAHAFLHITGLDHESSSSAAIKMKRQEKIVLARAGFTA